MIEDRPWNGRSEAEEPEGLGDRIGRIGFWTSLLAIAFTAGALLTAAELFPGTAIARASRGGKAFYDKLTASQNVYLSDLWWPERRADRGVTIHRPDMAQQGLTLYTSGHASAAFLIDMEGEVVHEWRRPFSEVWSADASPIAKPQPDAFVYFRKAVVYPNGDLLAIYEASGDTPYGYGIVKLDRDSNVVWSYLGTTHHELDVGPDGRIYALTHDFSSDRLEGFDNLADPRLDDYLVVLSPEGEELEKIRLIDLVAESDYRQFLHTVSSYAIGDALHTNSVEVITPESARNFPYGEAGDVLLSFRELGAIGVLDLERQQLAWMQRGAWIGQHDPDILPNGNILLFDNYGNHRRPNGISRVIEFDPESLEITWQYVGSEAAPLDSLIRSDQQRLANGNTLITESNGGRLVEVTPAGEIAWEFVNPVRHEGPEIPDRRIPIMASAERIDPATLDFETNGSASALPSGFEQQNQEIRP